jgi:hypothetical protein
MRRLLLSRIISVVLLCSIWGCAVYSKGYGALNPDQNVTRSFEAFQMNPNFAYYYSGSETYPNAIIGLDKKYKLEPDLWKQMDTTPKNFKDMITQMQTKALSYRLSQHGYAILDDRHRQIGVWYSIISATTSVKMIDDQTVLIYTPPLGTYLRYDDR